jgi:hypothetical protein
MSLRQAIRKVITTSPGQTISVRYVAGILQLSIPISLRRLIRKANAPPPRIERFNVEPSRVSANSTVTLTWNILNCEDGCSIGITKRIPGVGDNIPFRDNLLTSGTTTETVTRDTDYTLRASTAGKPTASRTTIVDVISPPTGYSSLVIVNIHTERRSLNVWIFDRNIGNWEHKGSLSYNQSKTITLQTGRFYDIVCVDQGALNCNGRNDPTIVSCRRYFLPNIYGDQNGRSIQVPVS